MYYLRLAVMTILLGNAACSTHDDNRQRAAPPKSFRQLLKKFKLLPLPLTINTTGQFSPEMFPEMTATDTLFIKSPDAPGRCFGLLPDTSRYYGLVWLAPAEVYQVKVSTFTKSGEKIGERSLAVGECGDDCGFSCSETLLIRANYSIYSTDSITSSECNDAGLIRPGTTKKYVKMITGRVRPTGEIDLSGVKTVATPQAKQLTPLTTKMTMQKNSVLTNAQLRYTSDGRSGTVHYHSRESSFDMWYEFAGGDALAIIGIPTLQQWESQTKLPLAYRAEVLQFIAEQVIRDQVASGGYFDIDQNTITIYSGQKPVIINQ